MILSFRDEATEDIFHGRNTKAARGISPELWNRIQNKLDMLNAAVRLSDLRIPPSNRLEKLRARWEGFYSIRVNEQYRIVFRFEAKNCADVQCTDYH